jgi:glycosyltransferase involved in cell wall biosynthesis
MERGKTILIITPYLPYHNIIVTGFVDDVAPFYRRCRVSAAPLFIGGGMIFKVLEAMSFGLPVVATTIANEGIMAKDGEELLIADEPDTFSRTIASLMKDAELWRSVSDRGRQMVNSKYSWDVVMEQYLKDLDLR